MRNKLIYIICIATGLLFFCEGARAQSVFDKILDNKFLDAVECMEQGDVQQAEDLLREVLYLNSENDAAWYYLAMVYIYNADLEGARRCHEKAVELDPGNFWYRYRLARLASISSRDEAIAMYERIIEDFPKKSNLYFEIMDLYIANCDYEKALETIFEIENVIGPSEQVAVYAYKIYYTLGKEDEGLEYLKKYNSRYSSPIVLTILADHELSMYNDTLAISYYDEALELDSTLPTALSGKAEAYRMSRRYEEYFPALNRYIESPAGSVQEKTDYLTALVEQSDPHFVKRFMPRIDTTMQKLSDMHSPDSLVYNLRAKYYYYTGRDDASAEQFRAGAEAYPESLGSAASYVEFLMFVGKWDELSVEGRKAFERFPDETTFLEMAGVGDYNRGEYNAVLDVCEQVIKTAPRDSSATLRSWSTMGDVYHLLGESKKAYKAYDKALRINPNYVYVLNNYAYYLSVEGKNLKKAYDMSRKTVDAEPDNATYLDTFGWILYLRGELTEAKSFFKSAMLYGGKDSAVILDHYADVLYALKEYDLAFIYWNLALRKNTEDDVPGLEAKVEQKRKEAGR